MRRRTSQLSSLLLAFRVSVSAPFGATSRPLNFETDMLHRNVWFTPCNMPKYLNPNSTSLNQRDKSLNKRTVICAIARNWGQATCQPLSHIPIRRRHPRKVETTVLKSDGEKSKSYKSRSINKDGIPDAFGPEFSLVAVLPWCCSSTGGGGLYIVGLASAAHSGLSVA